MNTNRQWLLANRPHGLVGDANFEYTETNIPEPADGEVLVRNLYLSFDPTQRRLDGGPGILPTTSGHRRTNARRLNWASRRIAAR